MVIGATGAGRSAAPRAGMLARLETFTGQLYLAVKVLRPVTLSLAEERRPDSVLRD
jgi:hypothetical protein